MNGVYGGRDKLAIPWNQIISLVDSLRFPEASGEPCGQLPLSGKATFFVRPNAT